VRCPGWFVLGLAVGLVLGLIVGVLSLTPAAYSVTHIHSSSRFDRSERGLHAQAVRFSHADLVTWTEVRGSRGNAIRVARMRSWSPAPTDLGISWTKGWRVLRRGVFCPTRITHEGVRSYVAWMLFDSGVLVMVAHLASHVQDGKAFRHNQRAVQWRAAVRGWGARWKRLDRRFEPAMSVLTADWNVDTKKAMWRHRVRRHFDGLHLTWRRPFPTAGTHRGGRLIDATLTDGSGRARLMRDDGSSDHRPYSERLRRVS